MRRTWCCVVGAEIGNGLVEGSMAIEAQEQEQYSYGYLRTAILEMAVCIWSAGLVTSRTREMIDDGLDILLHASVLWKWRDWIWKWTKRDAR